jgi:hypothetical protein
LNPALPRAAASRPPALTQPRTRIRAGYCSSEDCHSCLLASLLPCVAWAHNQQRAFDLGFASQLALYFLLVYALRTAAFAVLVRARAPARLRVARARTRAHAFRAAAQRAALPFRSALPLCASALPRAHCA